MRGDSGNSRLIKVAGPLLEAACAKSTANALSL
jgi:hypothetical protein